MYEKGEGVLPKKQNSIGLEAIVLAGSKKPHNTHKETEERVNRIKLLFLFFSINSLFDEKREKILVFFNNMNKYGIAVKKSETNRMNHFFHIEVPGLKINTKIERAIKIIDKNP